MVIEVGDEVIFELIGFALQEGFHELSAFFFHSFIQVDSDIAKISLEFCQHFLKWVPLFPSPNSDLRGTISTQDQDAVSANTPAQMKEQIDRSGIAPV